MPNIVKLIEQNELADAQALIEKQLFQHVGTRIQEKRKMVVAEMFKNREDELGPQGEPFVQTESLSSRLGKLKSRVKKYAKTRPLHRASKWADKQIGLF